MPHPEMTASSDEALRECRSCGTSIPLTEPILVKFNRCYYCGRHLPFGSIWSNRTAPVIAVAVIGLIAIWWSSILS